MPQNNQQVYEEYWSITLAYTNIHSDKFIATLKAIMCFVDNHRNTEYSSQLYGQLQEEVGKANGLKNTSLRKSINQFVKLGFINSKLKSYHTECSAFLSAKTDRLRKSIFSKIVYTNSSFNRSVSTDSVCQEIKFLIKTVEHIGKLTKNDVVALMMSGDVSEITKGYLEDEELKNIIHCPDFLSFKSRKYNQINYLFKILRMLEGLVIKDKCLYFEEDATRLFGNDYQYITNCRDPYLQKLYKIQLEEETKTKLGSPKCMIEYLDYPVLIASHIKPYINSSKEEAFDPDNGLLLSKNMDSLFDQGYISFDDKGEILISTKLSKELHTQLKKYCLDNKFLNLKRTGYLKYHRENKFRS